MKLETLLENIKVMKVYGRIDVDIQGIQYDSRRVKQGEVFVCIRGFKVDGHEFAAGAVRNGASAVVVENRLELPDSVTQIVVENGREALAKISAQFYGHPSNDFNLIGVTGTNGKTSTTFLIKKILEKASHKVGLIGTIENRIGDRVLQADRTTPESLELQGLFNDMKNEKVHSVVMEVSSHSLDLHRVDECQFKVGVFTNLTQDHLDFHGTMENYLHAKSKLFTKCEKGIINIDDPASQYIINQATCEVITYGIDKKADLQASNIQIDATGVSFDVTVENKVYSIDFKTPGKFSVYNALAALSVCYILGVPMDIVKAGLEEIEGVAGRCESIQTYKEFAVIIDYAHTPDGLENILSTVNEFAKGRKITVFGCGGDRDRTKRPIMGEIAAKLSDFIIITSDNPRSEEPESIIDEIEVGVKQVGKPYIRITDRKDAIGYAIQMAEKDDVITIAGKGHENYQILKDQTIHFDDKEIAKQFLQEA